ncbi:unnamed protein product, partial [Chrysoparadoxa australica]
MDADELAEMQSLRAAVDLLQANTQVLWLAYGAASVFFLHTGYSMIHVGCAQAKNSKSVLITSIFDAGIGAVIWWLLGAGVSFGEDLYPFTNENGFIGTDGYATASSCFRASGELSAASLRESSLCWGQWFLLYSFACTSVTIVAGATAERIVFGAYLCFSILWLGLVFPVVVHWGWSQGGWASPHHPADDSLLFDCGVLDNAGAGIVHVTGGLAAFIGAAFLGPRQGRFIEGVTRDLGQVSWVYQTLGTLIIWFGWFGMIGATSYLHDDLPLDAAYSSIRGMAMCAISAGASSVTSVLLGLVTDQVIDPEYANNGILAGLVAISGGARVVHPEAAFVIGVVGALCFFFSARLLLKLEVDDVVNAAPVHLFAGTWGLLAPGLFTDKSLYAASVAPERAGHCCGAFYGCGGAQLGANFVFLLAALAWVGAWSVTLFFVTKKLRRLRVDEDVEGVGLDLSKHGGLSMAVSSKSGCCRLCLKQHPIHSHFHTTRALPLPFAPTPQANNMPIPDSMYGSGGPAPGSTAPDPFPGGQILP